MTKWDEWYDEWGGGTCALDPVSPPKPFPTPTSSPHLRVIPEPPPLQENWIPAQGRYDEGGQYDEVGRLV